MEGMYMDENDMYYDEEDMHSVNSEMSTEEDEPPTEVALCDKVYNKGDLILIHGTDCEYKCDDKDTLQQHRNEQYAYINYK